MTYSAADYEAKIRDLEEQHARSVALNVSEAQRYAADLAAARGVTARLREALLSGATDEVQAMALADAAQGLLGAYLTNGQWTAVCAAFLSLHEEHKATRGELVALRDGIAIVLAVTPRSVK